ncbi:MAG TPA: ATP-dependent DNA helicase RecG [Candidatus Dormibacteraeota bacterium]|nr:ATP-dependent DNA helicase RecG [Candidatus Dormibacteraeota bacterium]
MSSKLAGEVLYLKGVGPHRAALLAERGIQTFEDLLGYLPFRYEDRIHFSTIRDITFGHVAAGNAYTIRAKVVSGNTVRYAHGRTIIYNLLVQDSTGALHCKFFHGGYLEGRFKSGQELILHGKVEVDRLRPSRIAMINPQVETLGEGDADSTEVGRIVPVYEAIGKLSSRTIRRMVYQVLGFLDEEIADPLPLSLRQRLKFPSRREALAYAHFPPPSQNIEALNAFRSPAHQRLIFEECFFYQLSLAVNRQATRSQPGIAFRVREEPIRQAVKRILPFKPTTAQKRVLSEIVADLERPVPMSRLLQGDVGSGKTIVALEAAVIAIENGYQAVLMAPTEILAVQHYLAAKRILGGVAGRQGYQADLLISGLKSAEKKAVLERIRSGAAQMVVGTHALIEENVEFARLGFVAIDEQHRFGVLQRKRLMDKAASHGTAPDVLVMTATPIPRTLSLTLYGDLDVSVIDEMPPGRTPIATRRTTDRHIRGVWDFLRSEIERGRQAYIVYPVIEESKQELKAAMVEYERLSQDEFPQMKLGLLHGRLPSEQKEEIMDRFRRGEIQVLVSTTVIEVGVDVANATVMVIEHAERFGLAQLHQLRGRIGRGTEKSHCILVAAEPLTEDAQQRLDALVRTLDGFELAELDLRMRGPGEFFGTRQHGDQGFHIANPLRDREILELARREAFALTEDPAQREPLRRLMDSLAAHWHRRYHLARVG